MVENGTIPASSQGFPTSAIRLANPPHLSHLILTSSMYGRWGLCPANLLHPAIALFLSSSFSPITVNSRQSSQTQIGKAKPQYRLLEISQSSILDSQSNSLFKPNSGIQVIFRAIFFILSRKGSIAIYHSSTTRQTNSVLQRQQAG